MLTSSSESSDDSLDSDELSEPRSNEESDSNELSSSLGGPPSRRVRQDVTGIAQGVGNGTPKRPENSKSGLYPCLDEFILGVPFGGPKWDPGRRTGFGLNWVLINEAKRSKSKGIDVPVSQARSKRLRRLRPWF